MLMIQSAPATALSRIGGTEYSTDSTTQVAYATWYAGGRRTAAALPRQHQPQAGRGKAPRRRRRAAEVGDVSFVAVERAVEGERAAVEADDPERDAEQCLGEVSARPETGDPDREEVSECGVPREDRPFRGAKVEEVVEPGPQQPVARAPGHAHQQRPRCLAARRSPCRVRSGCTRSTDAVSGATMPASPPVAIARGEPVPGHSARIRRTMPSTASAAP